MLADKRLKAMTAFCSSEKDYRRHVELEHIHVSNGMAEATNGHMLVIAHFPTDTSDYPKLPDNIGETPGDAMYSREQIDKAFAALLKKSRLPILQNIVLTQDGKTSTAIGTDMADVTAVTRTPDYTYPNVKQVWPCGDAPHTEFSLDGKLLAEICKLAIQHGNEVHKIIFRVYDDKKAVMYQIPSYDRPEGYAFKGLIMPLRFDQDDRTPLDTYDERQAVKPQVAEVTEITE